MIYRNSWEIRCGAPGCQNVHRSVGDWSEYAYRTVSPYRIPMSSGWMVQRNRCLAHHSHLIYADHRMYCPDHAPIWKKYVEAIKSWDERQGQHRKNYWQVLKSWWHPNLADPQPEKPW